MWILTVTIDSRVYIAVLSELLMNIDLVCLLAATVLFLVDSVHIACS